MTSYQRLKQTVAYLEQRNREADRIIAGLRAQLKAAGIRERPTLLGIRGDEFLTDLNTGRDLLVQ